jgi:hypothetical protein
MQNHLKSAKHLAAVKKANGGKKGNVSYERIGRPNQSLNVLLLLVVSQAKPAVNQEAFINPETTGTTIRHLPCGR